MINKLISLIFSRTAKNTFFIFSGNALSLIFAFIFTVVLVRILSFENIGYFSAVFSFLLLISDISDIGIGTSLSRFLPSLKSEKIKQSSFLKTAFILQGLIGIAVSSVVFIFSGFLSKAILHAPEFTKLFQIASFGILGAILANFFLQALSAKERFLTASFTSVLIGFSRVITIVILGILHSINLEGVVWAQSLGYIIVGIMGVFLIDPEFLFQKKVEGDMKKLISFSKFVGIARSLTALASRLDVLMILAITKSAYATGVYATASRLTVMYPLFSGSFSTVIAPRLSSNLSKKEVNKFIRKVILVTGGIIFTIILLLIIAFPFMTVLFPQKGAMSVGVFRILLISMIFFVGSIPSVSISIYYLKKPQILTINSIIQVVIVFFSNLILIPKYGNYGAAYSLIMAYGITFFLTSYLALYYFKLHNE